MAADTRSCLDRTLVHTDTSMVNTLFHQILYEPWSVSRQNCGLSHLSGLWPQILWIYVFRAARSTSLEREVFER